MRCYASRLSDYLIVIFRPHVTFYCDLNYDPFLYMQDNKKKYGFTISLPEYGETIETLWDTTKGENVIRTLLALTLRANVSF